MAALAANKPPLRFGVVYFSNGVDPKNWWAKGAGDALELGPSGAPLAPVKKDILFLKGLYNHQAFTHTSPHMGRIRERLLVIEALDENDVLADRT